MHICRCHVHVRRVPQPCRKECAGQARSARGRGGGRGRNVRAVRTTGVIVDTSVVFVAYSAAGAACACASLCVLADAPEPPESLEPPESQPSLPACRGPPSPPGSNAAAAAEEAGGGRPNGSYGGGEGEGGGASGGGEGDDDEVAGGAQAVLSTVTSEDHDPARSPSVASFNDVAAHVATRGGVALPPQPPPSPLPQTLQMPQTPQTPQPSQPPQLPQLPPSPPPGALAVLRLLSTDATAVLAVVYGLCFGYAGAFETVVVVTRGVAGGPLGESAVGPATAVVVGTAALAAVPLSYASVLCGGRLCRAVVAVAFGPLAYVALGVAVALTGSNPSDDGAKEAGGSPLLCRSWPSLVAVQLLLGLGRSSWESVNVAATVELFARKSTHELSTLMAARSMCNGLGAAVAFVLVPFLSSLEAALALTGIGAVAAVAFIAAAMRASHKDGESIAAVDGGDGVEGEGDSNDLGARLKISWPRLEDAAPDPHAHPKSNQARG